MLVKDAIKTKDKIFIFDMESNSLFISNGTPWPILFDFEEESIFKSMDMETHIKELEPPWQELSQPGPAIKNKIIKFIFENKYVYYIGNTKEIMVNQ